MMPGQISNAGDVASNGSSSVVMTPGQTSNGAVVASNGSFSRDRVSYVENEFTPLIPSELYNLVRLLQEAGAKLDLQGKALLFPHGGMISLDGIFKHEPEGVSVHKKEFICFMLELANGLVSGISSMYGASQKGLVWGILAWLSTSTINISGLESRTDSQFGVGQSVARKRAQQVLGYLITPPTAYMAGESALRLVCNETNATSLHMAPWKWVVGGLAGLSNVGASGELNKVSLATYPRVIQKFYQRVFRGKHSPWASQPVDVFFRIVIIILSMLLFFSCLAALIARGDPIFSTLVSISVIFAYIVFCFTAVGGLALFHKAILNSLMGMEDTLHRMCTQIPGYHRPLNSYSKLDVFMQVFFFAITALFMYVGGINYFELDKDVERQEGFLESTMDIFKKIALIPYPVETVISLTIMSCGSVLIKIFRKIINNRRSMAATLQQRADENGHIDAIMNFLRGSQALASDQAINCDELLKKIVQAVIQGRFSDPSVTSV